MTLLTPEIRKQALSEIESAWRHVFRPPEKLTVAEWAETNITLSGRETAHPGSLRFNRTPYLIDIVNDLADPEVEQITICSGTQLGKTMSILTMLAYCLAGDPAPTLLVLPNTDLAKSFSQNRLEPLIDDCEQLRKLKPANKDMWTLLEKWFPEATLRLVGSNSPANLASRPIRFLFMDELDKLGSTTNEASAVELATERVKSFWNRKIVCTSTPTTDIAPIWRRYKDGDQRQYHVPCPKCHSLQLLEFAQVKCSKGSFSDLKDDRGQYRYDEILPNVYYECQNCRFRILDKHKPAMLRQGVWQPQGTVGKHRSYHLNSLYSPWLKFADVVEKFLRIKDVDLQNFRNSWLAEPWIIEGKQNEIDDVLAHKSDYPPQTIPADNPLAVIATVDTQGDRFYYVVRSWHAGETSYLIEYGELEDFVGVKKLAASVYPCGSQTARITHVLLDSGGTRTKEVYAQCRDNRWIPLKGFAASRQQQPLRFSKLDDYGIQLLCCNVDFFKFGLQTKIEQPLGQDGAWHLHANTCAVYASSMTAERLVLQKDKSGYEVAKWIKVRERNDFWDCYSADTEILTETGWKFFPDVTLKDRLATVNLDTDQLQYQSPIALIDKPYSGEMVELTHRSCNLMVTPTHRMVVYKSVKKLPYIVEAKDLTMWDRLKTTCLWTGTDDPIMLPVPNTCSNPIEVDRETLARFMGWFVSEGSSYRYDKARTPQFKVTLYQEEGVKQDKLRKALELLPWKFQDFRRGKNKPISGFGICGEQAYCMVAGLGTVYSKYVPQWVKDSSPRVIEAFLESAVDGDGWRDGNHHAYCSVSRDLADDIQELWIKAGYSASVKVREPKPCDLSPQSPTVPQFHVHRKISKMLYLHNRKNNTPTFHRTTYDGRVYCATVPNGTLIVRRGQGCSVVCGNCENYQLAAAEKLRIRTRPAGDKMSAVANPRPSKTGVSCRGGFYGAGA